MIKVIIADDHILLAESLKSIIEYDNEIQVVGCALNGHEAFAMVEESPPDLVLMDIKMPECNGIEGTKMIKSTYPQVKVLILTTFEDDQNVYEALKNGADGYILKDITPEELIHAVKNAAKGFGIFSKTPFNIVAKQFNGKNAAEEQKKSIESFNLKERDLEIIRMVAEGRGNKEISIQICLSLGRTKNIISGILERLGLSDRNQLVGFAYKNRLL